MKLVICSTLYKPTFGNGTSFDTFVTIINVLVFVIYAIIIGFIATVILDFIKKDKKVISIISTSLAIIINLAFIIFSFVINNGIAKEGLSDYGSFSATIIPYLITLLSIGILVLNIKAHGKIKSKNSNGKEYIVGIIYISIIAAISYVFGVLILKNNGLYTYMLITILSLTLFKMKKGIIISIIPNVILLVLSEVLQVSYDFGVDSTHLTISANVFLLFIPLLIYIGTILTYVILNKLLSSITKHSTILNILLILGCIIVNYIILNIFYNSVYLKEYSSTLLIPTVEILVFTLLGHFLFRECLNNGTISI